MHKLSISSLIWVNRVLRRLIIVTTNHFSLLDGIITYFKLTTYFQRSRLYFKSLAFIGLHHRRHLKNLFHLIIKEDYLIVLSDNYSIIVNFHKTTEHIKELSLLSCTFKVVSISLVKSTGKEINEQQSYRLVKRYTNKSSLIYMWVVPNANIYQTQKVCHHLYSLIVA